MTASGDAIRTAVAALFDVPPESTAFWSGAGISGDPPTCGPLGNRLTDRVLTEVFDRAAVLDPLRDAYSALNLSRDRPRLETVLDVAVTQYGVGVLDTLLADMAQAEPNDNHRLFAEHLALGGRHATANFDTCIEKAGHADTRVVHFHGAFGPRGQTAELGATVGRIQNGLPTGLVAELDCLLQQARMVVVVGYSGLDYFDVDPYWRDACRRGLLRGTRVVWVNHAQGWGITEGAASQRKQLRVFADGDAEVFEVAAPTREVLNLLAAGWGLRPVTRRTGHNPVSTEMKVSTADRAQATTRLLATVGLWPAAGRRLREVRRSLVVDEREWAAQVCWAAGRYRQAADHWAFVYSGDEPGATAMRAERLASCQWMRGQYRRARRTALAAIRLAAQHDVTPSTRLLLAETLSRVLVHMRRLPDTRLLVTRGWIDVAANVLDTAVADADGGLGVHLRARAESARAHLFGRSAGEPDGALVTEGWVRDFDEAEALTAMLNYQHGDLRRRADTEDPPQPWELRRHRDRFLAVGAVADAARVPLLPGAATAFPVGQVILGFAHSDWTWYHLARMTGAYMVTRVRQQRRQAASAHRAAGS